MNSLHLLWQFLLLASLSWSKAVEVNHLLLRSADEETLGSLLFSHYPSRNLRQSDIGRIKMNHGRARINNPSRVELDLTIEGINLTYYLHQNNDVFDSDALFLVQSKNKSVQIEAKRIITKVKHYKGENAILAVEENSFVGRIIFNNTIVEIKYELDRLMVDKAHKFEGMCDANETFAILSTNKSKEGRNLEVTRWTNCFYNDDIKRSFRIGLAITNKLFTSAFSGNPENVKVWAESLISSANLVYSKQLNIELTVGFLYISQITEGRDSSCPPGSVCEWNNPKCDMQLRDQLQAFTRWKKNEIPSSHRFQGVWHLFDDCLMNSLQKLGLAYIGVLCQLPYNTGISEYSAQGLIEDTWLTFMHEVGHNFGAYHSFEEGMGKTGGIMDYGDFRLDNEYQFNTKYRKAEMCREINQNVNRCPAFKIHITERPTRLPTRIPTPKPTITPTYTEHFINKLPPQTTGHLTPSPFSFSSAQGVNSCSDMSPTWIYFSDKTPASCESLVSHCSSYDFVRTRCCRTCSNPRPTPEPTPACSDKDPTGIRFRNGRMAECSELKAYCSSHLFVSLKCCATCSS